MIDGLLGYDSIDFTYYTEPIIFDENFPLKFINFECINTGKLND